MADKKAQLGDSVAFHNGAVGIVDQVNENSVIVSVIQNDTDNVYGGNRTVINHKNYEIIKDKK